MVNSNTSIKEFIDNLADEKLQNFKSKEYTIKVDRKWGFRLDHQGVNQDGSKKHRLFIQPLGKKGGGTSHASKTGSAGYLAQVHLSDPTDPQTVRDTLWLSWADDKGKTVKKLP